MAWLESHQSLQRHPKTHRLSRLLGINAPATIGHLLCLWWWCMDYAQDGELSGYEPEDIADAAMWDGEPTVFFEALLSAGFLERTDEGVLVHDWDEYGGRLNEIRERNRDRQRRFRERHRDQSVPYNKSNGHVTVTSALVTGLQDTTQQTQQNKTDNGETDAPPTSVSSVHKTDLQVVCGKLGIAKDREAEELVERSMAMVPGTDHVARALSCKGRYEQWSKKTELQRAGHYRQWCENDTTPAPWKTATTSNGPPSTNGKHELSSDGREYGTWINPTYVRHDTPIPSAIPQVQALFHALKSTGTCSMREWDDLASMNPQVRADGTIVFPAPDDRSRDTVQRYVYDLENACRGTDLKFEIRRDA